MLSPEIFDALKEHFPAKDIEWRVQRADVEGSKPWAMVLAYITNRAVQERLDEVLGAGGWQNDFKASPDGGVLCGISIKVGDEWVTKWDGAENTDIEPVKGGLSGAMKRAAVQWGIGRYLYELETKFVPLQKEKPVDMNSGWQTHYDKKTNSKWFWRIPELPVWANPEHDGDK